MKEELSVGAEGNHESAQPLDRQSTSILQEVPVTALYHALWSSMLPVGNLYLPFSVIEIDTSITNRMTMTPGVTKTERTQRMHGALLAMVLIDQSID